MTYLPHTSPHPLSCLMETAGLYDLLDRYKAARSAHMARKAHVHRLRDICLITQAIGTMLRTIIGTEKFNYAIKRKWEMLTSPQWRARVLRDLGGEAALERWEARAALAKARTREPLPERSAARAGDGRRASSENGKQKSVITCQDGIFRLAPIQRRSAGLSRERASDYTRSVRPAPIDLELLDLRAIPYPLIPVEPYELRGQSKIYNDHPHLPEGMLIEAEKPGYIAAPRASRRQAKPMALLPPNTPINPTPPARDAKLHPQWAGESILKPD